MSFFPIIAADYPIVAINEIAWMGTILSSDDEWIELKNNTSQPLDLSGWRLATNDGTPDIFLSGIVPAGGYFLLERTDDNSVASISANQIYTGALSNGGEELVLYDNSGNIIDSVFATDGWPAGDNPSKATMERIDSLLPADSANWQSSFIAGGTAAADNSQSSAPVADQQPDDIADGNTEDIQPVDWQAGPADIVINEFMPDPPSGQPEWVELYNNSNFFIDLADWSIEDGKGKILSLMGIIQPGQIMAFDLSVSKLNNSGDLIILKSGQEIIIDKIAYGNWEDGNVSDNAFLPDKGQSVARKNNGQDSNNDYYDFIVTIQPTRGLPNIIIEPIKEESMDETIESEDSPTSSRSAVGKIIINEILPNPSAEEDEEFIELKNLDNKKIDLTGWILQDNSKRKYIIDCDYYEDCLLSPGEMAAIFRSQSGLALNNTGGDIVRLFFPGGELADEVFYNDKAQDDVSYSRDDNNDWHWTKILTPEQENIFILEEDDRKEDAAAINNEIFSPIKISEILPNPVGSDMVGEFVELYNPNSVEVDLTGWQIDDEEGGSRPHTINGGKIGAEKYAVLSRGETKLALNNDSDVVRLFSPDGILQDEIDYERAKEGLSYCLSDSGWNWTSKLTPAQENIVVLSAVVSPAASSVNKGLVDIDLAEIRDLAVGDKVRTRGVVAVEPGVLGSQIFYLAGSGIQIYSYKKDFPKLAIGDYVEVTGEISEAGGERRIKTASAADITVLERQADPEPHQMEISEVGESCEGFLVKLIGTVIEKNGSNIYIDDGTGEAKIYINKNSGIDIAGISEGASLSVTGIVSETKTGYRILPRQQSDLEIVGEVQGAAEQAKAANWSQLEKYLLATMIFLAIANFWLMWQNWQLKKSGWRIVEEDK